MTEHSAFLAPERPQGSGMVSGQLVHAVATYPFTRCGIVVRRGWRRRALAFEPEDPDVCGRCRDAVLRSAHGWQRA